MKFKLCKHGHLVCPHCVIEKERLGNYDSRIQKTPVEPTRHITFGVNRKYY
jgi:hypothetical protein